MGRFDPQRPRRRNPRLSLSPEEVLRHALRILQSDSSLLLDFMGKLGIEPVLMVSYVSGEDQQWAGPPGDWPEHVKNYDVTGDQILSWDLVYAYKRFLASDTNFRSNDPLEPYKESLKVLRAEGL